MKSKTLFPVIFVFILFASSCKKESVTTPPIVGKWMNTGVYSDPANGGHGWETVTRLHEFVSFNPDTKFYFFTDTPGNTGTYDFNISSKDLLLYFEANGYGTTNRSEKRKVESITTDKLILSFISPADGMTYKTAYSRVN